VVETYADPSLPSALTGSCLRSLWRRGGVNLSSGTATGRRQTPQHLTTRLEDFLVLTYMVGFGGFWI